MGMYIAFAELAEGEGGREFEFLRTGTFRDAYGRELEVTEELLDELVANFEVKLAGQEIPIDVDHKREEAAGWIASVRREGDRLVATPVWNDMGRKLVGDRIYRYVSATIDMGRKLLRSISLTNFPAVKDLKPVELAEWIARHRDEADEAPAQPVREVTVIVLGGEMGKQQDQRVEEPRNAEPVEELEEESKEVELAEPGDQGGQEEGADPAPAVPDLSSLTAGLREELLRELKQTLTAEFRKIEQQRNELTAQVIAELREEQDLVAFAERVTSTGRHALPVEPKTLQQVLKDLPPSNRRAVRDLLTSIYESGTVDFGEIGTAAGRERGKPKLEADVAAAVRQAMKSGMKLDQALAFLQEAGVVSDVEGYDLSEFEQ